MTKAAADTINSAHAKALFSDLIERAQRSKLSAAARRATGANRGVDNRHNDTGIDSYGVKTLR
jgi:hypothetical protein